MNVIFIHQNMPGQFRHLIRSVASDTANRIVCIGQRFDFTMPGVGRVTYEPPPSALPPDPNLFLAPLDTAVRNGLQVARACEAVRKNGYRPDVIVAHPGWGESLYVKEVFPDVPVLHYCEFFYRPHGADTNFAPNDQMAYVGESAFAHKAGVHVSAMQRHPDAYQHIDPKLVGNEMRVVVSELSGRANLVEKATQLGLREVARQSCEADREVIAVAQSHA